MVKRTTKPAKSKTDAANTLGPKLIDAASRGNLAQTKKLLAAGADPAWAHAWDRYQTDDPDDPDYDPDARPLNAGWTALHHAAKGRHYEIVRAMLEHSPAAARVENGDDDRAYDVTLDTRCALLLRACAAGDTVASYEARVARTASAGAEAAATGAFNVGEMPEDTNISERAPYAIEKTLDSSIHGEGARATPAGYVLVYRGSRHKKTGFRVSIEGKRGVAKFVTRITTLNDTNAPALDGQRFLVVDGQGRVHEIDGRQHTDRVVAEPGGEVDSVGYLDGGLFAFAGGKLHAFANDGTPWWTLAVDAFRVFGTGTPVVAVEPPLEKITKRFVLATATADGMRLLGRVEQYLERVWAYESGTYLICTGAADLVLQNPMAAPIEGKVLKSWPKPATLAKLPLFETR